MFNSKKTKTHFTPFFFRVLRAYFRQVRKVRWVYLILLPFFLAVIALVFEWEFVKHVLAFVSVEAVCHYCLGSAVAAAETA